MRVGDAQRELTRAKGARFLPPGYSYVYHHKWARSFRGSTRPVGAYFWYKGQDHLWWLGRFSAQTPTPGQYVLRRLDDTGPSSSRSLRLGTLRLLESFAAHGVYRCIKESLLFVILYATSTSPAELKYLVLPTWTRPNSRNRFSYSHAPVPASLPQDRVFVFVCFFSLCVVSCSDAVFTV